MKFFTAAVAAFAVCAGPLGVNANPVPVDLLSALLGGGSSSTTATTTTTAAVTAINAIQCYNIAYQSCDQFNLSLAQCKTLAKVCKNLAAANNCAATSTSALGNLLQNLTVFVGNALNISNLLSGILNIPSGNLLSILPTGGATSVTSPGILNLGSII